MGHSAEASEARRHAQRSKRAHSILMMGSAHCSICFLLRGTCAARAAEKGGTPWVLLRLVKVASYLNCNDVIGDEEGH